MNGAGLGAIFLGIIFFVRWVILTSDWKQKADKYDEIKKHDDEIYVKNLEEILLEEERTRTAKNIKLAYGLSKELLNIIASFFSRFRMQRSNIHDRI